ncbi:hypothetical protein AZA_85030 [Nitrospirillum viridazoti Y2]|nr:hypothetical protein AZA_85030 [Nitrospirillum amazonense Y2]
MEGRIPVQRPALQPARRDVGQLAQQGVDDDAQQHHVGLQELPRVHGHVADAGGGGDGLRHDQGQPHDAQGIAQAHQDGGQGARQDDAQVQGRGPQAVDPSHLH